MHKATSCLGETSLGKRSVHDSIPARQDLAAVYRRGGILSMHGDIAGWYGLVSTQLPDEIDLETLYQGAFATRGIKRDLGNPSLTRAVVASIQLAEVCKVLLDDGEPLRRRILRIGLREMGFLKIQYQPNSCDQKSATC